MIPQRKVKDDTLSGFASDPKELIMKNKTGDRSPRLIPLSLLFLFYPDGLRHLLPDN